MDGEGIPLLDFRDELEGATGGDDFATTSLDTQMLTGTVDDYYTSLGEGEPAAGKDY